jgi:biopolymer transport protein ExbD
MQFRTRRKRKVLINITPLIDVLFLLLIFFMVSSTFLEQPAIELELPDAQSAVVVEQKDYILFIDNKSNVYLNEKKVRMEDLESKIEDAFHGKKNKVLVLKADQDVSHGIVVKVLDIIKRVGVQKLIIGTKFEK